MSAAAGLRVWSAERVGRQLFVGEEPSTTRFETAYQYPCWGDKPVGGIWTSGLFDEGESEWTRWAERETPGKTRAFSRWEVFPDPQAKLLVVDKHTDLCNIQHAYRRRWTIDEHTPLFLVRRPGADVLWLNWDRIITDYDGFHLTHRGNQECHFHASGIDLNSWDVESTVWFRWVFVKQARHIDNQKGTSK